MATTYRLGHEQTKISTLLQSYFQSGNLNFLIGSGGSTPAITTVGNIEKQINDLLKEGHEAKADLATLDFIETLAESHTGFAAQQFSAEVAIALSRYSSLLKLIDRILFERKTALLPRQANIFTSNYDTFIEYAATRIPTLILNDGFRRSAVIDEDFVFAPECYFDRTYRAASVYSQSAEIPTINLIKFHGSLSWMRKSDKVVYLRVLPNKLSAEGRAVPARVVERLSEYFLILPNLRKYNRSLMERTYYDLLRLYANALEKENAVLVSFGFSFQDEHILDITRRALRNPTAQLLIFAFDDSAVADYEAKFEVNRNVAIFSAAQEQTLDFDAFNSFLEAVLPSEA